MTISKMHLAVKQKLDKTSSLELPSFEDEEIDFWLNDSILFYVKENCDGLNITRKGLEEDQRKIDNLRTIIVNNQSLAVSKTGSVDTSYYDNDKVFALPSDYFRYMGDQVTINVSGTTNKVESTPVTADTFTIKLKDPFSEHNLHYDIAEPLRMIRGDEIIYIHDGNYSITNCYLTYIKNPIKVNITSSPAVDCDLPDHTHQEIVDLTVRKLLENIESPRYASFIKESMPI